MEQVALVIGYWMMALLAIGAALAATTALIKVLSELAAAMGEAAHENALKLGAYLYALTWYRTRFGEYDEDFSKSLTTKGYEIRVSVKEEAD